MNELVGGMGIMGAQDGTMEQPSRTSMGIATYGNWDGRYGVFAAADFTRYYGAIKAVELGVPKGQLG